MLEASVYKKVHVRRRSEFGNVSVSTLFMLLGLSFLLACAISLSSVYLAWANVQNGLNIAKEGIMTSSFQVKIKSVDNPGNIIANKIAEDFRAAGYDEKLTVWFYEEPDEQLNDNVRVLAVYAVAEYPYSLGQLIKEVNIKCETSASVVPYSDDRIYKLGIDFGKVDVFVYDEKSNVPHQSFVLFANAPGGVSDARNKALNIAKKYWP